MHASRKRRMLKNDIVGAVLDDPLKIPDAIDWRKKGFKTPVINQGDCGSCYAFSIISSIQGQIFKMTNKTIHLSAQQLVDCSTVNGNYGCSGGSLVNTLRYLERAGGIMEQESYPYTAQVLNYVREKKNKVHQISEDKMFGKKLHIVFFF